MKKWLTNMINFDHSIITDYFGMMNIKARFNLALYGLLKHNDFPDIKMDHSIFGIIYDHIKKMIDYAGMEKELKANTNPLVQIVINSKPYEYDKAYKLYYQEKLKRNIKKYFLERKYYTMPKTTKWILISSLNGDTPKMSAEFDSEKELDEYVRHEAFLDPTFYPINKIEIPVAKEEYDFSSFENHPFKNDDELLISVAYKLSFKNKEMVDYNLETICVINDKDKIDKEWENFTKQDPANDLQFEEMFEAGFKRALYSSKIIFDSMAYKILIPLYPPKKEDPFDVIVNIRKKSKAESNIEEKSLSAVRSIYSDIMDKVYNEFRSEINRLVVQQIEKM